MSYLQRITNNDVGIRKYIASVSSLGFINNDRKFNDILCEFLKSKNIKYHRWNNKYKGLFKANLYNSETVQQNWNDFKIFIRETYPNEQVKNKLTQKQ